MLCSLHQIFALANSVVSEPSTYSVCIYLHHALFIMATQKKISLIAPNTFSLQEVFFDQMVC